MFKLLASVRARHPLCNLEIPQPQSFARTGAFRPVEQMNYQRSGTILKLSWWADLQFRKVALSHSTQRSLRSAPLLRTQGPEQPLSHHGMTSWPMH